MNKGVGLCWNILLGSLLGCGASASTGSIAQPRAQPRAQPQAEGSAEGSEAPSKEPIVPPNGSRISAVTPPTPSVVDEPTYEQFAQKWMTGLRSTVSGFGSFGAYATKTLPSPSGSNEAIEAMQWFNIWCSRHGGRPNGVDGGQGLERVGVPNSARGEVGRTAGYCLKGGQITAALALDPVSVSDGTELWLTHFSQKSLAGLDSELGPAATRTYLLPSAPAPAPEPAPRPPAASTRAGASEPAPAPGEVEKIKVENLSGVSGIPKYLYQHASADVRSFLTKGDYAVFVDVIAFNPSRSGNRYCWGMVGLTRPQPLDRNPRAPANLSSGFHAANPTEELVDCRVAALGLAFDEFLSRTPARMLEDSSLVDAGGKHKSRPADPTLVHTFSSTHSGFTPNEYVAQNVPREFSQAFDYRRLELVAVSTETHLKGQLVCFGLVGVTTSPPADRNPRWPAWYESMVNELPADEGSAAGAGDRCEGEALKRALGTLLDEPWDDTGILKKFNLTREDGVVPVRGVPTKPAPTAAQNPEASRNPSAPAFKTQATSFTNLRYECSNGDCVRIFPSGKRERFQAPRCFDPFKQTWEWKPEGC